MKRVGLGLLAAASLAAPATSHASTPLVPRDLSRLERFADTLLRVDPRSAPLARELREASARPVDPGLGIWVVDSRTALRLLPRLARSGELRDFSPDRPLRPASHVDPPEPLLHRQWWLAAVGADRVEPPGPGVPLTLIDSGLDVSHPEFAGRPDTELLTEQSVQGGSEHHGTAVASIAAAPVNGAGVVGVYPAARVRSWDVSPRGAPSTVELVRALADAARLGRGVVNVSLGVPFRDPIVEDAVAGAVGRGLAVVAAAGNDGETTNAPALPAVLPHVLTVAATAETGEAASFSTRSPAVDVAAPGVSLPAAVTLAADPSGYALVDGTSFATPIVAGAAAWVWTVRPELGPTQLLDVLRRSARDAGAPGRDPETGHGVLDLPAALAEPAPPVDPLEPNDDVDHVAPGGLFGRGRAALTRPGRGRATVSAALDAFEDPVDVYRVWLPAGRRVTVRSASRRDLVLELWRPETATVLARGVSRRVHLLDRSDRPGGRAETVSAQNAGRRGAYVYVSASVAARAALPDLAYRLTVTTAPAPRR